MIVGGPCAASGFPAIGIVEASDGIEEFVAAGALDGVVTVAGSGATGLLGGAFVVVVV